MTEPPRVVGRMEDIDGVPVTVSLNWDGTVRVEVGSFAQEGIAQTHGMADFDRKAADEFAHLFTSACLEAERNAKQASDG